MDPLWLVTLLIFGVALGVLLRLARIRFLQAGGRGTWWRRLWP